MSVCILRLDIWKAFDRIRRRPVLESVSACGLEGPEAALILRSTIDADMSFVLPNTVTSSPLTRQRGVGQGLPPSPVLFSHPVALKLAELDREFKTAGFGIRLGDWMCAQLGWADDVWLLGKSHEEITAMGRRLAAKFRAELGLEVRWESKAEWITAAADGTPGEVIIEGKRVVRRPLAEGIRCLGSTVTLDGRTRADVAERIAASWRSFWAKRHLLLCRRAPVAQRVALLEAVITSVLPRGPKAGQFRAVLLSSFGKCNTACAGVSLAVSAVLPSPWVGTSRERTGKSAD